MPPFAERTAPSFPSGEWVGFYNDRDAGPRHPWTMQLTFLEGRVRGSGRDEAGEFTLFGTYDTEDHCCTMTLVRAGRPQGTLTGYRESDFIWGTWNRPGGRRGGFQIWPYHAVPRDLLREPSCDAR